MTIAAMPHDDAEERERKPFEWDDKNPSNRFNQYHKSVCVRVE